MQIYLSPNKYCIVLKKRAQTWALQQLFYTNNRIFALALWAMCIKQMVKTAIAKEK